VVEWAETQNGLGITFAVLGGHEGGIARLVLAIDTFRLALQEMHREPRPLYWAAIQSNLGYADSKLGTQESGTARLESALASYRAALEEEPRDRVPLHWAMTQNRLGDTLRVLGERKGSTTRLKSALAAHRAALEEQPRERVPLDWAATQNSLGDTLRTLGELEGRAALFEQAVAAYLGALQERTRERAPFLWAVTKESLGLALQAWESERATPENWSGRSRRSERPWWCSSKGAQGTTSKAPKPTLHARRRWSPSDAAKARRSKRLSMSSHIKPHAGSKRRRRSTTHHKRDTADSLRLRTVPSKRLLHLLLDQITPENRHDEVDWGPPVGKEIW